MTDAPARVLVVDDHALLRAGIRAVLETIDGFVICGEAKDGDEALALVKETAPQVVLLDIDLPGRSGIDVAGRLRIDHPDVRVLILSMHATEDYAVLALHAGVAGYMLKESSASELEGALRAIMRGETYMSAAISQRMVEYLRRTTAAPAADPLTPRQRDVLTLVAEGLSTKEVAHRLSLSVKTVETHRAQIMERLDIHDVAGLVKYALRKGMVAP